MLRLLSICKLLHRSPVRAFDDVPLSLPKSRAPPAAPRFVVPPNCGGGSGSSLGGGGGDAFALPPTTLSPIRTRPGQPPPRQQPTPLLPLGTARLPDLSPHSPLFAPIVPAADGLGRCNRSSSCRQVS